MTQALAITCTSIPISIAYLRRGRADAPLLLFLYILVASAMLAWFSLPYIDWIPDTSAM